LVVVLVVREKDQVVREGMRVKNWRVEAIAVTCGGWWWYRMEPLLFIASGGAEAI
jgi:hypothetical protein